MSDEGHYQYGVQFQSKVLSIMALDPTFLQNYLDVIKPQYFTFDSHVALSRMILDYFKQYGILPTKAAVYATTWEHVNKFNIQDPTRSQLMSLGESIFDYDFSDADFTKEMIVKFGQHQSVSAGLLKAFDMLKGNKDLERIPAMLEEHVRVGSSRDVGHSFRDNYHRIKELIAMDGAYNPTRKCSTLIPELDSKLGGGLGAGELGTILGTSGGGKSMVLINFGVAAMSTGKHVVHFTIGDLSWFDVMVRYSARISGTPMEDIIKGDETYKEAVARHVSKSSNLRIKYFPPKTAYTHNIKAFLAQSKAMDRVEPGLIIVDYADKLATEKGGEDDYRDLGRVYDELIAIGREFNVPIWTASQTNRNARGKTLASVEDIADSWQKVANADVCISINVSDDERTRDEMRLYGAKVRRGQDGFQVKCKLERNRCYLHQIAG